MTLKLLIRLKLIVSFLRCSDIKNSSLRLSLTIFCANLKNSIVVLSNKKFWARLKDIFKEKKETTNFNISFTERFVCLHLNGGKNLPLIFSTQKQQKQHHQQTQEISKQRKKEIKRHDKKPTIFSETEFNFVIVQKSWIFQVSQPSQQPCW